MTKPWPRYVRHVHVKALRVTRLEPLTDDDPAVQAKRQLAMGVRVHFDEGHPPMLFDEEEWERLPFLKPGAYLVRTEGGDLHAWPEDDFALLYERMAPP